MAPLLVTKATVNLFSLFCCLFTFSQRKSRRDRRVISSSPFVFHAYLSVTFWVYLTIKMFRIPPKFIQSTKSAWNRISSFLFFKKKMIIRITDTVNCFTQIYFYFCRTRYALHGEYDWCWHPVPH